MIYISSPSDFRIGKTNHIFSVHDVEAGRQDEIRINNIKRYLGFYLVLQEIRPFIAKLPLK
jgi:hypothetical protein